MSFFRDPSRKNPSQVAEVAAFSTFAAVILHDRGYNYSNARTLEVAKCECAPFPLLCES